MKENPLQGERCSSQDKFIENQEPEADDDIYGSMTVRYVKRLDSLKRVSNTNLKPQQTKDLKRNNSESKGSKQLGFISYF